MKEQFKRESFFLIPFIILILALFILLSNYNKADIHIYINSRNNSFFDTFFQYWTYLGDGIFAVLITVILLFVKYRWALISAISNLAASIIVQILKRLVFKDHMRPRFYFEYIYNGEYNLSFIDGIIPGIHGSFPSGHTATAFALFFLFAVISKNKYLKFTFLILAMLVAYSRMYLSWHFLEDVLLGSLIGVLTTFFTVFYVNKLKNPKLDIKLFNIKSIKSDK